MHVFNAIISNRLKNTTSGHLGDDVFVEPVRSISRTVFTFFSNLIYIKMTCDICFSPSLRVVVVRLKKIK